MKRHNALTVILEHDMPDEAIQPLMEAITLLKGVQRVTGHVEGDLIDSAVATSRARYEIATRLYLLADEMMNNDRH